MKEEAHLDLNISTILEYKRRVGFMAENFRRLADVNATGNAVGLHAIRQIDGVPKQAVSE